VQQTSMTSMMPSLLGSAALLLNACSGPPTTTVIRPSHAPMNDTGVIDVSTQPSGVSVSPFATPDRPVRQTGPSLPTHPAYPVRDAQDLRMMQPLVDAGIPYGDGSMPPGDHVDFGAADDTSADPRAAVIGLYGELVSDRHATSTPTDGSTNLAQVTFATEGACFDPTIDPTGEWVAFASTMHQRSSDIYIKSRDGRTHTQLTGDPADDVMPAFSPTGQEVAFASNRGGSWDIYVMPVTGGAAVQVTSDADHELHPTWSPDGRKLAYCRYSSRSGVWEIWVIDIASPGRKQFLAYGMFPHWNPDVARNTILFQRARKRGSRYHSVWTIDYVSDEAVRPTEIVSASNAAAINPTWSPDGRRIAFVTVVEPETQPGGHPSMSDVWIVNADGTNRTNLTNGQYANFQPTWGSDGTVYFVSNRSGIDNVWGVRTGRAMRAVGPDSQIVNVDPSTANASDQ